MVPPLKRRVSFKIVTPKAKTDDERLCIKFNVHAHEIARYAHDGTSGAGSNMESLTRRPRKRTCSRGDLPNTCDAVPSAAYDDEQSIEYFSVTHQQWLNGTVHSVASPVIDSKDDALVLTTVTLAHGHQIRENIGLDLLRSTFKSGELVELFSGRQDGLRLAATIAPNQVLPRPLLHGYQVVVEGSGEVFENVPPHRLKRRFVRGQEVEVYRGPQLGWQFAEVHHTASADGCSAEILPLPSDLQSKYHDETLADTGDAIRTSKAKLTDSLASDLKTFSACDVGLWTWVPVCTEGSSPEWVASYLISPSAGSDQK
jgi:hypothetical protein